MKPITYHFKNHPDHPETDLFPFAIGTTTVEGMFHEHTHDFIELVVILKGQGEHTINNIAYSCRPGDVYVFHGDVAHAFSHSHGLTMTNVAFTPELFHGFSDDIRSMPGFQALFVVSSTRQSNFRCTMHLNPLSFAQIRLLLQTMENEYILKNEGFRSTISACLAQTIIQLSRLYSTTEMTVPKESSQTLRLAEVAAFIEMNLSQKHSIDNLAERACLSRRHFLRRFSTVYGKTPAQYILAKRLDRCAEMLRTTNKTLSEISFACGFFDSNYFVRQFSRGFSISPAKYRKLSQTLP